MKHDVVMCTILKDKTRFVREWIDYHLHVGIRHFFLYDNYETPTLAKELKALDEGKHWDRLRPFVTIMHLPGPNKQHQAIHHYLDTYRECSKWTLFLDGDEFLRLVKWPTLQDMLRDFEALSIPSSSSSSSSSTASSTSFSREKKDMKRLQGSGLTHAIVFSWRMFGSNGITTQPIDSVLRSFTKRQRNFNGHVKSLVRTHMVQRPMDPHCFFLRKKPGFAKGSITRRVNGSEFRNGLQGPLNHDYAFWGHEHFGFVCHYHLRSYKIYMERRSRGRGWSTNTKKRRVIHKEFQAADKSSNEMEDTSMAQLAETWGI